MKIFDGGVDPDGYPGRMATLRIARGLPGCGKTTALQRWRAEDPEHRIVLGRDDWRTVLGCLPVGKRHEEAAITIMLTAAVDALLRHGWDVGVDATHIQPGTLEHWQALAGQCWARWEVLDLTGTPVEVCVARDLARRDAGGRYVGEDVIRTMAARYLDHHPIQ